MNRKLRPFSLPLIACLPLALCLAACGGASPPAGAIPDPGLPGIDQGTTSRSAQTPPTELPETEIAGAQDHGAPLPGTDGDRTIVLDPGVPFETAQAATDFDLLMPAYLPESYEFHDVSVTSSKEASLNFVRQNPARLAVLVQTAAGARSQVSLSMVESVSEIILVRDLDGKWTYDEIGGEAVLEWWTADVQYRLIGITDLEEAIMVAESVQ